MQENPTSICKPPLSGIGSAALCQGEGFSLSNSTDRVTIHQNKLLRLLLCQNLRRYPLERIPCRVGHTGIAVTDRFEQRRNSRSRLLSKTADRTRRAHPEY